jgi:hypothetical protein
MGLGHLPHGARDDSHEKLRQGVKQGSFVST